MVAALFALHPINVENVAWVSELKTMLSAIFFFMALGAYRWYTQQLSPFRMAVVGFLFICGLLAKPQIITFPFVLLLWDYWPLCRMFPLTGDHDGTGIDKATPKPTVRALINEKYWLFAIAAADAVVTVFAENKTSVQQWPYSLSIRVGNGILSYSRYLGKAFWPVNLAFMYPHPGNALRWGQVWASFLLLVAVTIVVIVQRQRRYLLVGWLWFLGTMVPMIGLIQIDLPALADRYAYICFVGIFIMVCWNIADFARKKNLPAFVLPVASLLVLLLLAIATHRQLSYWHDSVAVWTHTLQVMPHNRHAYVNLGYLMQDQGHPKEALGYFYRASEEQPGDYESNLNIASLEHQQGNFGQAILYYEKVLAVSTDRRTNAQVWANMGHAYAALGDDGRAAECYRESLRIRSLPDIPPPRTAIDWLRKHVP